MGAIFHSGQSPNGKDVLGSFDYYQWPHDPNLTASVHLCPGLHANAKIAIFAKNRKNRKLCKEEDKSPTRTRDFGENCDFSQKSLKSPPFSGTCVFYHFSVVPCLRF